MNCNYLNQKVVKLSDSFGNLKKTYILHKYFTIYASGDIWGVAQVAITYSASLAMIQ